MESLYDIVICLGPNDYDMFESCISNVKLHVQNQNNIYIITCKTVIDMYSIKYNTIHFIDEMRFPFSKKYIDDLFKTPSRSGWYLQQLLKLYAPIVLEELLDNYLILDADVYFHRPVSFFKDNKIQFNIGSQYWEPYFEHMNKLHPSLSKIYQFSGICHLMPMKRYIVQSLFNMVESYHNTVFWKVFLDMVTPENYPHSGASEYEILLTYTLNTYSDECDIVKLEWEDDSPSININYGGIYQSCHWHKRRY